ncbi:MAG TPA: PilZ domain-containing protein [Tepidisphaeraceae bacterium]|jgi:hypothetical protein
MPANGHPQRKTSPERNTTTDDRRRRSRLPGATPGWVILESDAAKAELPWEVRVTDVSRNGVGFESCEELASGQVCRIRIGRGPLDLARRIRVIRCNPDQPNGTFHIGGEFV